MTLTYQGQCQFWITQYRLDHYGLPWPSEPAINHIVTHTTLYATLPYFATCYGSPGLGMCCWRWHEGRAIHPASVEWSWRSYSQWQWCGRVIMSSNSCSTREGLKPIPLNILTTIHPKNHTDCHLHHQHARRNIRRLTFNRNVVKLLDFVLELKNPYSVTVNVVVPLCNLTYSCIWLLIKGWMCVC